MDSGAVQHSTREVFGDTISQLGEENSNIVVLDADLSSSTQSGRFGRRFPDRFFNMGIAEANMIGTAAGLSLDGYIPFCCSFACFITGRYDTIRISVCYNEANVKIIGTHAGVAIGEDGTSQMGLEDVSLMRALPNMQILQPADAIEARAVIRYAVETPGPMYIRLTRQKLHPFHDSSYQFSPNTAEIVRLLGRDVVIIATGGVVWNALEAARILSTSHGIECGVINVPVIKPLDRALLHEAILRSALVVTVEDHSIIGGLGTAVAEVLAEVSVSASAAFLRLGLTDCFGESGPSEELYKKFKLDPHGISQEIVAFRSANCPS